MSPDGSITRLIGPLQAGNNGAIAALLERYFRQLIGLARQTLKDPGLQNADEDVALHAFDSFCRGARAGRFADLHDRAGLWALLVAITRNKTLKHLRDELRSKRGGGKVVPLSDLPAGGSGPAFEDPAPTPDLVAEMAEEVRRLLDLLGDDTLRTVAVETAAGLSIGEIAQELGCSARTVDRKLARIRTLWAQEVER